MNKNSFSGNRIFKLSTGEKVGTEDLEKQIEEVCHYLEYVVVAGNGEEQPVALIFPNKRLLSQPDYERTPEEGCFCPRNLDELGRCLSGCLKIANNKIGEESARIKSAAIIHDDTLMTSGEMTPEKVIEKYNALLQKMYGDNAPTNEEVYIIELK